MDKSSAERFLFEMGHTVVTSPYLVVVVNVLFVLFAVIIVYISTNNWRTWKERKKSRVHQHGKLCWLNGLFFDDNLEMAYREWERKALTVYSFKVIAVVFFAQAASSSVLWESYQEERISPELRSLGVQRYPSGATEVAVFFASLIILVCTGILGLESSWKRAIPSSLYPWLREVLLPSVLYVYTALWGVLDSYQTHRCSFGYWNYWTDIEVYLLPMTCAVNHWISQAPTNFVQTGVTPDMFDLFSRNNCTKQLVAFNEVVRPWLRVQIGLAYISKLYLPFFVYFLLGMTTYDMHFRCCCGKSRRRCGYGFSLIVLLIPLLFSLIRLVINIGVYSYLQFHFSAHLFILVVTYGFYGIVFALKRMWFVQTKFSERCSDQKRLIKNTFDDFSALVNVELFQEIEKNNSKFSAVLEGIADDDNETRVPLPFKRKLRQLLAYLRTTSQLCEKGETIIVWSHSLLKAYVNSLNYLQYAPEYQQINIRNVLEVIPYLYSTGNLASVRVEVEPNVPDMVSVEMSALLCCCTSLVRHSIHHGATRLIVKVSCAESSTKLRFETIDPRIFGEKAQVEDSELYSSNESNFGQAEESSNDLRVVHSTVDWLGEYCGVKTPYYTEIKIVNGKPTLCPYGSCFWFTLTNRGAKLAADLPTKSSVEMAGKDPGIPFEKHIVDQIETAAGLGQVKPKGDRLKEIQLNIDMPVWNKVTFLSILEGQEQEAISTFKIEHTEILQTLKQKYHEHNNVGVMREVHKIKSSAKIVGALKLEALCEEIEKQNGEVGLEYLESAISQLNDKFREYLSAARLDS